MTCGPLAAALCLLGAVAVDGDTIRAATPWGNQSFRLWGISAPERRDPGGPESTAHLAALLEGQALACDLAGPPSYSRLVVACRRVSDGADLACLQARAGHAIDWPTYSGGAYAGCHPKP